MVGMAKGATRREAQEELVSRGRRQLYISGRGQTHAHDYGARFEELLPIIKLNYDNGLPILFDQTMDGAFYARSESRDAKYYFEIWCVDSIDHYPVLKAYLEFIKVNIRPRPRFGKFDDLIRYSERRRLLRATPPSGLADISQQARMEDNETVEDFARRKGLTVAELEAAADHWKATNSEITARETTARATAQPRLKWDTDRQPDESPAHFAWRAYQAEAQAGTLHRGLIGQEDKDLAVKLASWMRSPAHREEAAAAGIDIPTLPEWNTRQAEAGKAKPERRPQTESQRVYSALTQRRYRARHGM